MTLAVKSCVGGDGAQIGNAVSLIKCLISDLACRSINIRQNACPMLSHTSLTSHSQPAKPDLTVSFFLPFFVFLDLFVCAPLYTSCFEKPSLHCSSKLPESLHRHCYQRRSFNPKLLRRHTRSTSPRLRIPLHWSDCGCVQNHPHYHYTSFALDILFPLTIEFVEGVHHV